MDLVRSGNSVQATTKGVTAFTLLLSRDNDRTMLYAAEVTIKLK